MHHPTDRIITQIVTFDRWRRFRFRLRLRNGHLPGGHQPFGQTLRLLVAIFLFDVVVHLEGIVAHLEGIVVHLEGFVAHLDGIVAHLEGIIPIILHFERFLHLCTKQEDWTNATERFYLTTHSTHFIYGYMKGRKEMFYLTMHSIHFIYGYMEGRNRWMNQKYVLNTPFRCSWILQLKHLNYLRKTNFNTKNVIKSYYDRNNRK